MYNIQKIFNNLNKLLLIILLLKNIIYLQFLKQNEWSMDNIHIVNCYINDN